MFTKVGKLITRNIQSSVVYDFTIRLIEMIIKLLANSTQFEIYLKGLQETLEELEKSFTRDMSSSFTEEIVRKHDIRIALLTSLRRQLNAAIKMPTKPNLVAAATNLKKKMAEYNWWVCKRLSYSDAKKIIRLMLVKMTQEPLAQWVAETSVQPILDDLRVIHEECDDLINNRIAEQGNIVTPQQKKARRQVIEVLLSTLDAIDFGIRFDPEAFAEIEKEVVQLIRITNVKTKSRNTRSLVDDSESGDDETSVESEADSNNSSADESLADDQTNAVSSTSDSADE